MRIILSVADVLDHSIEAVRVVDIPAAAALRPPVLADIIISRPSALAGASG
jgi:hypothetical protein